ncbi:aminotransferase class I/II-fold pyridoxal phosphate-dependent enzyme [Cellulomonas fimi]|nr:aminotransferase class I/II-fold pyridoxal phosphate-dependent enzyme [Cellulomonas fimi]MDC7121686.1 aminotransferase class I/II-fold pyridoxal phosphate-dependent enzyme [Cellulomonas fimi]
MEARGGTTIFDSVPLDALRRRTSQKWRRYPPDVLPMYVAEMDVPQPEAVIRAVSDAMRAGDTGYVHGPDYAEALAGFAATRYGWDVPVADCRLVPDVMLGIVEVLRLVTDPGDAVVINPPVYPPFVQFVAHADRRPLPAPLGPDGRLDLDALDTAFASATSGGRRAAYLLCHPHNPTGTLHTAAELAAVGELAGQHGVRVVADEIHAPLVTGGSAWSTDGGDTAPSPRDGAGSTGTLGAGSSGPVGDDGGGQDEARPRFVPTTTVIPSAIALHSASKAFNLAALKAAVAVPGPDARADLARLPEIVLHGVSHLGAVAHTTALRDCGDWLDAVLDGLRHNQRLLAELLATHLPAARWSPPDATYFAWLDLRDVPAVRDGADPARLALERGRVALNPGPTFGTPEGVGFARLNLAASTATLHEGVGRLASALA